jgi:hypothetical protein
MRLVGGKTYGAHEIEWDMCIITNRRIGFTLAVGDKVNVRGTNTMN